MAPALTVKAGQGLERAALLAEAVRLAAAGELDLQLRAVVLAHPIPAQVSPKISAAGSTGAKRCMNSKCDVTHRTCCNIPSLVRACAGRGTRQR